MSDLACTLAALHVYPVKSCAGIAPPRWPLGPFGLDLDREWMLVDADGEMLSQRELPRMALVHTAVKGNEVLLRAPGMLPLHLRVDAVEQPCRVRVWDDELPAYDMGALPAQWFNDFLGRPARLARFDTAQRRLASAQWCDGVEAEVAFADGFPLLVASTASLAELNRRLAVRGAAAVTMARFRPNLVLDGLQAFDEDHIDTLEIDADGGTVTLRLVKPCVRCSIPNVDPATAETGAEPGRTLAGFRADARMQGGITFGMNAIVVAGHEHTLAVGQAARATFKV